MKNSSDTIGNRTRDLPACSAVPQPTAPPRAPPPLPQTVIFNKLEFKMSEGQKFPLCLIICIRSHLSTRSCIVDGFSLFRCLRWYSRLVGCEGVGKSTRCSTLSSLWN